MIDWDELERLESQQETDPAFDALGETYVPGEGGDGCQFFVIGEAPGAQEHIQLRPFVGPSGIILRQLMYIAGLNSNEPHAVINTWLTNVIKFRPPGNRNPTDAEIAAARPYLRREWQAVGEPKIVIPVGGIALRAITGTRMSILKVAGKMMTFPSAPDMFVWPMVHPRFGLSNPSVRPLLEKDWEQLRGWLDVAYKR